MSIRARVDQARAIGTLTTREIAWTHDLILNGAAPTDERLASHRVTEPGLRQGATTRETVASPPGMTPGHVAAGMIHLTSGMMAHAAGMIIAGGQKTIAMAGNHVAHPARTVSDPVLRMTMTARRAGPGVVVVAHPAPNIEIVTGIKMTYAQEGWLAGGKIHVSGWPSAVSVASIVSNANMVGMTSARHKHQPGAPRRQGYLGYRVARQRWSSSPSSLPAR